MSNITIVMSAHNAAKTVGEAIESLLCQTYGDFRLLLFDDGSSDTTAEIAASFDDPRLDLRRLAENRGLTRNLIDGVAEADGAYIARMDADDIAMPTRLERQVAYLDANPTIDVLGTTALFFDNTGAEFLGRQPEHHEDIAIALFFGFTMMHSSIMLRASAMRAGHWNYNPDFRYSQDFDLWSRMLKAHRFANLPEPLIRLREHPGRITRSKRAEQQKYSTLIRARQVARLLPGADPDEVDVLAAAARNEVPYEPSGIAKLESCLIRLVHANDELRIYEPQKFASAAAALFQRMCRQSLQYGRRAGIRYLRSPLRRRASPEPLRPWMSFLALSGMAAAGICLRRQKN